MRYILRLNNIFWSSITIKNNYLLYPLRYYRIFKMGDTYFRIYAYLQHVHVQQKLTTSKKPLYSIPTNIIRRVADDYNKIKNIPSTK